MSKKELKKEDIKPAEKFVEKDIRPIYAEDMIRAVRFTVKASTCLNDIDELSEGEKYFKFGFKGACKKWASFIENHTGEMMKEYALHDENALNDVYTAFENALSDVEYKTKERTALMKLYCKLKSILFDINTMEKHKEDYYNLFMFINTKAFVHKMEKQYGDIRSCLDKKGRNPIEITVFLNNLGNTIIASDETNEPSK